MSRKQDTAAALAGILSAKRGGDGVVAPALSVATQEEPEAAPPPSPALPPSPPVVAAKNAERAVAEGRGGKSSDPNYSQYSIYLRKTTRKKVGRALDDADTGQDFSELVEELLQQWIASRT
jgi:hypothetical protein